MTCPALNQGYLMITFLRGLHSKLSPGLEENNPLVVHTHVYQNTFNTKQPIGACGQMSCLSLFGICYWLVQEITEPLHGKHEEIELWQRLIKLLCGLPITMLSS
jgi:hypothetical protein